MIPVSVFGSSSLVPCYAVSKAADTTAVAGTNVTFELMVANLSTVDGTAIQLSDTFEGTTYDMWAPFPLAAGQTVTRSFTTALPCLVGPAVNSDYGVVSAGEPYSTTAVLPVTVDVVAPTLVASYLMSAAQIDVGATLYVTATSTTNGTPITSWTWDFGDGSPTVSGPLASHVYTAPGVYSVELTIGEGCDFTAASTKQVTVGEVPQEYLVFLPLVLKLTP